MAGSLSSTEAVREFRMHPHTVLRLILTGRVRAEKDKDGKWRVNRADLEHWNRNRKRTQWTPRPEEVGATA